MTSEQPRLTLYEDHVAASAGTELAAAPRVLYVREGDVEVSGDAGRVRVLAGSAWHGTERCAMAAGPHGATVLRYELRQGGLPPAPRTGRVLLDHPIALDPNQRYLMRCDRVEFDPGGEALTLARSWSSVDTECPPCARAVAYSELGMPQNDFARSPSNLDARCAGLRTC